MAVAAVVPTREEAQEVVVAVRKVAVVAVAADQQVLQVQMEILQAAAGGLEAAEAAVEGGEFERAAQVELAAAVEELLAQ